MTRSAGSSLVVLGLLVVATPATGQVTVLRNLAFGTVISGASTSVGVTSASAAEWQVRVSLLSIAGSFTLTLPTTLTRTTGGNTMPISFCSTCGRWRTNSNNVSGATTFDPANPVTFSLLGLGSIVYVWLGGAVTPPLSQAPGTYTGTVVLTTSGLVL